MKAVINNVRLRDERAVRSGIGKGTKHGDGSVVLRLGSAVLLFGVSLSAVAQVDLREFTYKAMLNARQEVPTTQKEDKEGIMSDAYWKRWDKKVQKKIDADIEKNRKADAVVDIPDAKPGTTVKIRQITSDFWYGSHIFNYNQLGSHEANEKYKSLFGNLFNSATVAFYWKNWETEKGRQRFREETWDTEEWWNKQEDPYQYVHWRRPASDPVVEFLRERKLRVQGHPLVWGNRKWQMPMWTTEGMLTPEERKTYEGLVSVSPYFKDYTKDITQFKKEYQDMSVGQLEEAFPQLAENYQKYFDSHIRDIAEYYGDKVESWDVVNESAQDYKSGALQSSKKLCKSAYGIMPGDYTYNSFKTADAAFPKNVKLNINDWLIEKSYVDQTSDLLKRGCRIDLLGMQMHLFNPKQCADIADGAAIETPESEWDKLSTLSQAGLPIHVSEITITAPSDDEKGRKIQAIIARNLYRLWFSSASVAGITWWNVVDNCGAKGEPSTSGLFTRDMQPKMVFFALDRLINYEWRTNTEAKPDKDGKLRFRGFRGSYELTYTDNAGNVKTLLYHVK